MKARVCDTHFSNPSYQQTPPIDTPTHTFTCNTLKIKTAQELSILQHSTMTTFTIHLQYNISTTLTCSILHPVSSPSLASTASLNLTAWNHHHAMLKSFPLLSRRYSTLFRHTTKLFLFWQY